VWRSFGDICSASPYPLVTALGAAWLAFDGSDMLFLARDCAPATPVVTGIVVAAAVVALITARTSLSKDYASARKSIPVTCLLSLIF